MTVKSEVARYQADGLSMVGQFYWDDKISGPRPAVLVFPEAFGLGKHAKSRAERLAGLGYAALACDLYGESKTFETLEQVMPNLMPLFENPDKTRARAKAALDFVSKRPEANAKKVAAIGYCFGGTMALELGRSGAPIAGIVGFHSGLKNSRPDDAKNIKGKVLVCIGADDPAIQPPERAAFEEEMRNGKVDWRMHLYGGILHSFTNPDADGKVLPELRRYNAGADTRSWNEMIALFNEVFA